MLGKGKQFCVPEPCVGVENAVKSNILNINKVYISSIKKFFSFRGGVKFADLSEEQSKPQICLALKFFFNH